VLLDQVPSLGIEKVVAEIFADTLVVLCLGGIPLGACQGERRRQVNLAADMVENAYRNTRVVLEKAAVLPQHTELNGESAAVSSPRQRSTWLRSASESVQLRASSSSLGSSGNATPRRGGVPAEEEA
jgi:hypothetical protein